ncbi:Pantoate-beta-alanine ligase [Cyathus striatus]|nr:Pantoate-beta-alanine ligase [Cyathus striatus]
MSTSSGSQLPPSPIPLFNTVKDFRQWRRKAYADQKSVGFVPTMGALHEGHLSLVRRSLAENDLTVLSVFVNPAQFAPHEDLATYPRTLPRDIELFTSESFHDLATNTVRTASAIFVPTVDEMYPTGISQNIADQKGTFVEVKGYGHQMEGVTRPTFFRGVATVVTKLFNVIEPTNAYFGQKDIQQALLLRRMSKDLLLSHPDPEHLHIIPTARDPVTDLALSSRNAYLSDDGRNVAPTLREALKAAATAWESGSSKIGCVHRAVEVIEARKSKAKAEGLNVSMDLDYIQLNDSDTFEVLDDNTTRTSGNDPHRPVILSGALYVDKTRLIDNVILGDVSRIIG